MYRILNVHKEYPDSVNHTELQRDKLYQKLIKKQPGCNICGVGCYSPRKHAWGADAALCRMLYFTVFIKLEYDENYADSSLFVVSHATFKCNTSRWVPNKWGKY